MRLEKLYAILDPSVRSDMSWKLMAEQQLDGGARWLQLRNKTASSRELLMQATELVRLARKRKARVVVNDRADVAWLAHASGVHVGQSDLSVRQVRKILGPKKIVGVSTHGMEQALVAAKTTASYIAVGPIFPTRSKVNADPAIGLETLREIRRHVTKPIVAIGGISLETAAEVIAAGADSVAVISDLLCAKDIAERTRQFIRLLGK
jgi:thiamine-phosphate pyrophosphorylase